jgi:hypothetical protein
MLKDTSADSADSLTTRSNTTTTMSNTAFNDGTYYWVRLKPHYKLPEQSEFITPDWEPMKWSAKQNCFLTSGDVVHGYAPTLMAEIGDAICPPTPPVSAEESTALARAAFVTARKRDNSESHHPVSLAKHWTGHGFKDQFVDRHWQNFLEGWFAARKQSEQ